MHPPRIGAAPDRGDHRACDEPRSETTLTGTEREQLEAFVHDNRRELLAVLDGLTEEQARRRLVPSLTTPLALVKHATFVEKVWFHVSLAGRTRDEVGVPEAAEDSWVLADDDTVASVSAAYRAACAEADAYAAAYGLDDLARAQPARPAHAALDLPAPGRGAGPARRPRRHPARADPRRRGALREPCGAGLEQHLEAASSRTGTPSCSALSALEPGLSPTTT